jgi:hypothetical protein
MTLAVGPPGLAACVNAERRKFNIILSGRKEIANHLHCGAHTVHRWEDYGLHVVRPAQSHVMAGPERFDHWVREVYRKRLLSSGAL